MTKVNIPSILVSPDSPTPKSTKSFYSLFSLKTPSIKSPLKSPQKSPIKSFKSTTNSSKNELRYVLNGAKRVLTKFQHFNYHHELCVKCTGFIEQVIKILEEVGTLSENNRDQLIETKEYNDCSTLIFEIEYYFKKLDQVNSNQFVVKETLKKFVLNLEIVVNAIQRASEHLKPKKASKWSPSIVSKIKTIGKLMVMKKESDRIKDDSDFAPLMHEEEPVIQQGLNIPTSEVEDPSNIPTSVEDPLNVPTSVEDPIEVPVIVEDPLKVPTSEKEDPIEPIIQREVIFTESLIREDESPNEPIIQQDIIMPTGFIKQELIISTGLNRGGNNEGMFFNNKVSEKCIGIIPRDDIKFTKFQNEMSYLMKLSCGCNNILSVKGFTERSIMDNPSILIYIVNYLISSLFLKLTYRNKYATMLVTEWAEFNLPDYLEKNDLDWSAKLSIARGIANALNHIHNLNLLHYNVKSDSVLLDHNLEPKLHKFGMDAKDCVFLKSARSLKSSNWSAPEVKRGGKYTSASEVYSFGVILWEIATQECLSGNKSIDKRDIDDAPTNYLTLMKSALDQEPQNRPTMQEMFDSLSQLESFYSARQQKQQNLSIRNIINILHTNSVVSSSSEDHLTIDSASSSRVTSRANSPAPSISDHEYMFFTNNVNTTSKVENSTDNDEFTVSESTSSIEKSSTVNVNDTSNLEKSSIFTNHVVESPISTKNVDCNSDNENSSTFTLTNDVDYHSGTEISTSTNDVDYHSDTESSTIFTKDVETNAEKSTIFTNDVDYHSDTSTIFTKDVEINAENSLTSTNDVDYHSDTESSTIFIKDVETNAEKSTTFTNDVDYHSDTENSTTITNNVETNAENSPTFTNNVDHNSNIEILQTLTNDIKSTSNIEKSSSTIIHHVESASNAENSPTFTNNIKSTSDTKILTNDVNSASNIETIDLNEFQKLHNNKQYRKAFRLINGYAKQDPKVLFWMGYYHYKGYHESSPYKPDIMTGFKYLEAGAKLNDPDALYYSSYILFNCCLNGIENRYEIALKHLKKASEQNHPASMLELGKYMINGKFGCKKDVTYGKTLIRRSKELGNRSAKFNQKVDDRKYRSASNASTSPLKRNVYQKKSRTSSNASSASSIRPMIVSKSFSSKKTNTITMDQFRHSAYV